MHNEPYYITTTLPYVNADPHIGFAMEIIRADVIARYNRLLGKDVVFNTGTDEHGQKIYQKALELGLTPQQYCDSKVVQYKKLKGLLNLSYTHFIRTTDEHHVEAAKEFWKRCAANGDIYKAKYQIKYCIGCELEKTDSELVDGKCPIHPNLELQILDEENYFFRWSNYQQKLLDLYSSRPDFVVPAFRLEEITNFVKGGLKDFSISRLKSKMPWGIEVPGDNEQVMYVWFDALVDYISTLGWPQNEENFKKFWPGVQIAGKDNLRQQSAMWQAMLMSAGLPNSRQIYVEGFITSEGQKMSKSLGNVVDPIALVESYGIDPVRYYLLREIPSFDDGDFSISRFRELYNSDLANGLGNLVARVAKLCEKSGFEFSETEGIFTSLYPEIHDSIEKYNVSHALELLWNDIRGLDKFIEATKPWELLKNNSAGAQDALQHAVNTIRQIGLMLAPFLPVTAEAISRQYANPKIISEPPLFPRLTD